MKKITCTLTMQNVDCLCFDINAETLERKTVLYIGENFKGFDRKYLPGYEILKIKGISEPSTIKYGVDLDTFINSAEFSTDYKVGFMNRRMQLVTTTYKRYNVLTSEVETATIEGEYSERELKNLCKNVNCVYILTENVERNASGYYYMTYEHFTEIADRIADDADDADDDKTNAFESEYVGK